MRGDWSYRQLGTVADFRGGGTPSKTNASLWGGEIPWVSPKDMKVRDIASSSETITKEAIVDSAARLIPAGAVLIVVRSGILARTIPIAVASRELTVNQDLKALCPSDMIQTEYLRYFLEASETAILQRVTRGATVHRLTTDSLKGLVVPLPSKAEQKRIVAILDEALEGIDAAASHAERNLANARDLFENYLNVTFTSPGIAWVERTLEEIAFIKHGFAFKSEHFMDVGDHVLLTPGNFFEEGGYRDRGAKQKYYLGEIPDGFILPKGALLLAMTEQAAGLLGSPAIIPEGDRFLHNQRLGLVQPRDGVPWCTEFFFHAFNAKSFRKRVHSEASGVKVRHTSPTKLGNVSMSFPATVAEQNAVATKLDRLHQRTAELKATYKRRQTALAELKQSILHKAFSGDLTAKEADRQMAVA